MDGAWACIAVLTPVFVLIGQKLIHRLVKAFVRDLLETFILQTFLDRLGLEETQGSLQTFTRTISNRPTVRRGTKGPTALGVVAIKLVAAFVAFILIRRRSPVVKQRT